MCPTPGDVPNDHADDDPRKVALTERDVEDARRLLALLSASVEQSDDRAAPVIATGPTTGREHLIARARYMLEARKVRVRQFGPAMFGEPGWDMLLILFVGQGGARISASRLASECGASKSSGTRWIDYLADRRFIVRKQHPTDKRTQFVELTTEARDALEHYFATIVPSRDDHG